MTPRAAPALGRLLLLVLCLTLTLGLTEANMAMPQPRFLAKSDAWDNDPAMQAVAASFRGAHGVVLHLGGSVTYSSPYTAWARDGKGKSAEDEAILR